jgi:hypothetical protein
VRKRIAAVLTTAATLAALVGLHSTPASAQLVSAQPFASYGTGSIQSVNVLQLGQTQTLNVQTAFAGQSVNSTGLGGLISNEMGYAVQPADPALAGRTAYGRGAGLEVGVGVPIGAAENQILLSGIAEAAAPPPTDIVTRQIGPLALGSLAYANVLRSRAQSIFDPATCVIGRPMTYGEGEAAGVQLVGTPAPNGVLTTPLVGAALPVDSDDPRNVNRSRSVSYLLPNGDGTFGLVSETRQTIAPVSLLGGLATLELLGEWALRAIATGKPGGSRIEYAPVGAGPQTNVAVLTIGGNPTTITLQQLLGPGGLVIPIPLVADIRIGAPPRAIGGVGAPTLTDTSAAAAVDVVSVSLLDLGGLGLQVADIRVGHMEAAVSVPPGGIRCNIPVAKTSAQPTVFVGNQATINISIPADAAQYAALFGCDLINIKVQDVHTVTSGNVTFNIVQASHGGVISPDGRTVTWDNLGNYRLGDPPIVLTVVLDIPTTSGAGELEDTADVSASLGNCQGTDTGGQDIVGQAINGLGIGNAIATGRITLQGPAVSRGQLPPTGGNAVPLVAGSALVLAAVAIRRRLTA